MEQSDFRMDFTMEVLDVDDATRVMTFALRPDPRRYEWQERDGERLLYDRYDNVFITENALRDAAAMVKGMPITFAPPEISDARDYLRSRRPAIASSLRGEPNSEGLADASADLLASLAEHALDFTVLSFDLVGSTQLVSTLGTPDFARLVTSLLDEAGRVVALFRGHVLKYTGDGLLAFFPGPTKNTQNDLGIDCAMTLIGLVREALNPELEAAGLPQVRARVGLDHGKAAVLVLGSEATKRHADLIGKVVSLATKIEKLAPPDGICVGEAAERAMHVQWREHLVPIELPNDWTFEDESGRPYPVFRVTSAERFSTSGILVAEAAAEPEDLRPPEA